MLFIKFVMNSVFVRCHQIGAMGMKFIRQCFWSVKNDISHCFLITATLNPANYGLVGKANAFIILIQIKQCSRVDVLFFECMHWFHF